MVCCLDVNVVFSKGPFSGFWFVFRGRKPFLPSWFSGTCLNQTCEVPPPQGFEVTTHEKLRYFWKPSRSETQTTHMLLQFYRFPPLSPKASSNQGAEIDDFCESHFCSIEKPLQPLSLVRIISNLLGTSMWSASLMFCAPVVWYSQIVWRRVNHVRSLTQRFHSGFLFWPPRKSKQSLMLLPPNKFRLTQPKDRQTLFSYQTCNPPKSLKGLPLAQSVFRNPSS